MKITNIEIKNIRSHAHSESSLDDYTVFIGENNSGKSNIFYSLRWFFGDIKLSKEDVTKNTSGNPEVTITCSSEDIPYQFLEGKLGEFKIKAFVKKEDLNKPQSPQYELLEPFSKKLKNKDIKELGNIIYVPSLRDLGDELKFTANSTISKLVGKYLIENIKNPDDPKKNVYSDIVRDIERLSRILNSENGASKSLERCINKYMLDYPDINLSFKLVAPETEELVKSSFTPCITSGTQELDLKSQGMGYQRSLIFSLLCSMTEIQNSEYTLYLVEEPELFLHPNHQLEFRNKLKELSTQENSQTLINTHSPFFVNNVSDYSQIKRITRDIVSKVHEISSDEISDICTANGQLMAIAMDKTGAEHVDVAKNIAEEDKLRYLLWVNPERASALFSKKVILVEGNTEKAVFSYLLNSKDGDLYNHPKKSDVVVIETVGKYHFYKFANLLNYYGINTWIFYDGDNDKETGPISQKYLNIIIEDMVNKGIIEGSFRINPYIEEYLGVSKCKINNDVEMYRHFENNTDTFKDSKNYKDFVNYVKKILE
ncbi:ATP-dependent endonuclease [Methanococcus maripaludis]|uniref:Putative ATP-dependent endonuclease of OLD family n=1 Tax=Methanococcus maripaludis TaxID=39152 RepID=A0A7J9PPH0_METMI|nr:AAA family ATPase [Methanococcus maripaludis]MBA2868044.1 putative ATP-dependent endonuclease of OLD family [Methanococcus maripaludis]